MRIFKLLTLLCLYVEITSAQELTLKKDLDFAKRDSSCFLTPANGFKKGRNNLVFGSSVGAGTAILAGLGYSWYSDYEREGFHFFDDGLEWRGMDKIGHVVTAYYVADYIANMYQWAGVDERKAAWRGALTSFAFQGAIEVMDGFSQGWGFSVADLASNTGGIGLFLLQNRINGNQPFTLKFGFAPTKYRKYRTSLLGENELIALLKDYNGQSYWLSMNLGMLTGSSKMPPWLNIAFGYGAAGMLGGKYNPSINNEGMILPRYERYSQFYLSPDIDFTKIKTKNIYLKTIFKALSFYKFPFPGLEVNTKGQVKFNWMK